LERAQTVGSIEGKAVSDIATTEGLSVAYPYEPMWVALRRLGIHDVSRLPVVKREGSRELVGVVRRGDIIRAYHHAIIKKASHQHRVEVLRLGKLDDTSFVDINISPQSPVVGHRVSEINLPAECLIVSVRRGRKLYVAHGYTVFQAGDRVTVFADSDSIPGVRECLASKPPGYEEVEEHSVRHREFIIPVGATCCGKKVRDLSLPPDCILVSIRRSDETIVPRGNTVLQAGDVVEIFGVQDELTEVEICLSR